MLAIGPLGIGPFELLLILAVVVIIFGVGRLPEVGGAIGKSIREFRRAAQEPEERRQLSEPEARSDVEPPVSKAPLAAESTLRCPRCGSSNAAGTKFCSECGASLLGCPRCGTSNAPGAKFCAECGAPLQTSVN